MRVGCGYDVHKLGKGEKLILGGVEIEFEKGLVGHSDGDVLTHALMDSLLGALGSGDIGKHFPDEDPSYEGISSLILLEEIALLVKEKGFMVNNADMTIIAQRPKLAPYLSQMEKNLASVLEVGEERLNIKATTTEGLGFIGKKQGIAAQAIASLNFKESGN